jgi:hypothetical protein
MPGVKSECSLAVKLLHFRRTNSRRCSRGRRPPPTTRFGGRPPLCGRAPHAVQFLKAGGDIYDLQKRMGHASIKTMEEYLKFLTAEEERAVKFGTKQMRAN